MAEYTPTVWVNNQPPPLSAENLNHLTDELKLQASERSILHSLGTASTWTDGADPALTTAGTLNEMERVCQVVAADLGFSYSPTTWSAGWTPRNATRFNRLEQQAAANRAQLDGTVGTPIADFSDLNAVFRPDWTRPQSGASQGTGGVYEITSPYDGFQFLCNADMPAPWDSTSKLCYANWQYTEQGPGSPVNQAESWEFYVYLPTQALYNGWTVNTLWEFHTSASSGQHIALYSNGTYRIGRQSGPGGTYDYTQGPSIAWDAWTKIDIDIRWSYSSNGYYNVSFDGTPYLTYNGVTLFDAGDPYLQFGWYGSRQLSNEIRIAGIRYERL